MTFLTSSQRAKGSLNPEYAKMCGGKFSHYNFLTAMQHASSIEKLDKDHGRRAKATIYHCEFCGAEHIGHLDNPKFRFEETIRENRDKHVTEILKSGKAVARQGKPTMLCPQQSS